MCPDTVYLIALDTTFVNTCSMRWASPSTQSFPLTLISFRKSTPGRTLGDSILWTLCKSFQIDVGARPSCNFPSSILRTSNKLFMMEAMNAVHNCIPDTKLCALSGRSSGMAARAESMAPSGFLSSWAKYAVMFRSVSTLASWEARRVCISRRALACFLSSVTSWATPTTPMMLASESLRVVALTNRTTGSPDLDVTWTS
mmetsp:Transcript_16445/g.35793  ORF Transcript_16445/g.35793 Transcript_16445/m.35793 type:complete len:200 (+) Transcript_16445:830-1429(+)